MEQYLFVKIDAVSKHAVEAKRKRKLKKSDGSKPTLLTSQSVDESQIQNFILPQSNTRTDLRQSLKGVFSYRTKVGSGPDDADNVPIGMLKEWVKEEKEKV